MYKLIEIRLRKAEIKKNTLAHKKSLANISFDPISKIGTKKIYNAQMINLIGDDITIYRNKTFKENEFFYDYLKKQVKAKRKMGHLTIIEK